MFWALLAARTAGETEVSAGRIAAALLRSDDLAAWSHLVRTMEDPKSLSLDDCVRRVTDDLGARGIELGSPEHLGSVRPLPLDAAVRRAVDRIMSRGDAGEIVTPVELFRALLAADPELARRWGDGSLP